MDYRLRDGKRVRVRPLGPRDARRLAEGMERLSDRSRFLRFLGAVATLSESALRYLTDVDQVNHIAWVAVDPDAPGEPALGVARCVRLPAEEAVAEVAVVVADELQERGLGTLLLLVLARAAAERGVATFRANVLRENDTVLQALRELGARGTPEGGVLRVDVPVAEVADLARSWNEAVPVE